MRRFRPFQRVIMGVVVVMTVVVVVVIMIMIVVMMVVMIVIVVMIVMGLAVRLVGIGVKLLGGHLGLSVTLASSRM